VRFDESLANCQSETRPANDSRHLAVYAVETIEDSIEFPGRHAEALVGH